MANLLTGNGILIIKIPTTTVSIYLRYAFSQNLQHLEKNRFILVDRNRVNLDQCDQNLEYLFKILENEIISYDEKEKLVPKILIGYLDLKTPSKRVNITICIVFILYIKNVAGFYIMMENLIKAIR